MAAGLRLLCRLASHGGAGTLTRDIDRTTNPGKWVKAENGEAMKSSGGKCRHWGQMGSKLFPVQALPSSFFCGHLPTCMCIYLIHCNPMDYTVHGILQARILEWVVIPFSGGSSQARDQTHSPALQADSLPTELSGKPKLLSSQSYGFSSSHVWMWDLDHKEDWAPKNWCFQTVVLEKTLESPLDCKEIKPGNFLKEINPEYSLQGLMLKLKTQYFGHLMWRVSSLEKNLMLGKIEGKGRGQQRMRWLVGIADLMDMSLSKLQESEG